MGSSSLGYQFLYGTGNHEMLKDVLDMEDFLESRKVSLIPYSVWKLSMETSLRVAVPFLPPPPKFIDFVIKKIIRSIDLTQE